jgi:hypothetical protein
MKSQEKIENAKICINELLGISQKQTAKYLLKTEEADFFSDIFAGIGKIFKTMPETYGTDGQELEAIAMLHYFKNGLDWYITEKDCEKEQLQVFGMVNGECGYISLIEVIAADAELDYYWEPTKLKELK